MEMPLRPLHPFTFAAVCGAQHDAPSPWHLQGAEEVDRSADPSIFGYWGKHRHLHDRPPPPLFFCRSPSHDSLPGGKESGRGTRGHTRTYCTVPGVQDAADNMRWIGSSKLEIVFFFFFNHLKAWSPARRSWFIHLPGPAGASPDRTHMSTGMYENTAQVDFSSLTTTYMEQMFAVVC